MERNSKKNYGQPYKCKTQIILECGIAASLCAEEMQLADRQGTMVVADRWAAMFGANKSEPRAAGDGQS